MISAAFARAAATHPAPGMPPRVVVGPSSITTRRPRTPIRHRVAPVIRL
jgi:hypothetical protein